MKVARIFSLSLLLVLFVPLVVSAQQKKLIGTLDSSMAGNNPGCSYFVGRRLIFVLDAINGTWMNIDGREVTLTLVKATRPKGRSKVGSRSTERYMSGDITVDIVHVITKLGEWVSDMSATFTVRKGNRTQVVIAIGQCGD